MAKWGEKQQIEFTTCSLVEEPRVFFDRDSRIKLELLMEEYTNREWIGYLVGKESLDEGFLIEDIIIPPHKEAYTASAEAEPFHTPDPCIGVIHSHHTMGAFHSQTDDTHVDRNFPISITVAKKNKEEMVFDVVCIRKTPCGKTSFSSGEVFFIQPEPSFDTEAWLKEAKENIDKGAVKVHKVYTPQGKYYSPYHASHQQELQEKTNKSALFCKEVSDMREKIKDERGVDLPRADIEDVLSQMLPTGWEI